VVDLLARRKDQAEVLTDDLDDVFTRYYQQHPDADDPRRCWLQRP
jgi:hypothetical protein